MITHESHAELLGRMPRPQCERELRQEIADSLQGLVAAIDQATGHRYHSCVVDDFRIGEVRLEAAACLVPLRFSGSARTGEGGTGPVERIAGKALAVIDDTERVEFRDVALVTEPTYIAPDVGVLD